MILAMRPGKGLKITPADSGIVVELDDALQEGLALKGDGEGGDGVKDGQGPGALRWRGQWSATADYLRNDIVIRATAAEIATGTQAGTYICVRDTINGIAADNDTEPGSAPNRGQDTYSNPRWKKFAIGEWSKFVIKGTASTGSNHTITIDADADTVNTGFATVTIKQLNVTSMNGPHSGGLVDSITALQLNYNDAVGVVDPTYGSFSLKKESIGAGVALGLQSITFDDGNGTKYSMDVLGSVPTPV